MASSNRHWPSMFKSKPCNHHQWQHDSLISSPCHRPSFTTGGCEERSPEPKPRWNPKPEQIRILEAIFNSGMVNPPRDEIRKIRAQLQEYGQVGDASVFYWFQNRKSRSKHKLRHLQNTSKQQQQQQQNSSPQNQTTTLLPPTTITLTTTAPSSSSSSSEKSSPKGSSKRNSALSLSSPGAIDHMSNSPTGSVNETYGRAHNEFVLEPFYFPVQQGSSGGGFTQGFCFSELSNVVQGQNHTVGPCTSLLLSEMLNSSASASKKEVYQGEKIMKMQSPVSCSITNPPITHTIGLAHPNYPSSTDHMHNVTTTVPYHLNQIQGVGDHESHAVESARSTVFINDVAFEVAVGPFNVREAFGDDVALINSSGQLVLTNEWGVTLHPLQHAASYYLLPLSMTETYMKWGS